MTRLKQRKYSPKFVKTTILTTLLVLVSLSVNALNFYTDSTSIKTTEKLGLPLLNDSLALDDNTKTTTEFFRFGPVDEFFMDWDTAVVDPYQFDIKEITYDFPVCLFISPDDVYSLPLKSMSPTSPFGPRWGRHHKGIDFGLNVGDSVYNMFDGMVRISVYSPTFGNFVVVRHFNGLETIYAHLSERNVSSGDIVKAGDCVGLGGNTGRSTGPHLHFEIRYRGVAFDPENLFDLGYEDIVGEELTIEPTLFNYLKYKSKRSHSGAKGNYHTIQNGETLYSIAKKYGTSVNALCRLNGISESSIIRAGNRLRVR